MSLRLLLRYYISVDAAIAAYIDIVIMMILRGCRDAAARYRHAATL